MFAFPFLGGYSFPIAFRTFPVLFDIAHMMFRQLHAGIPAFLSGFQSYNSSAVVLPATHRTTLWMSSPKYK